MNEKPFHLPMGFSEALARLARVNKPTARAAAKKLAKEADLRENTGVPTEMSGRTVAKRKPAG